MHLLHLSLSSLGVPFHSWRITHAKHHAMTCHVTNDQVFVPATRSSLNLPAFEPSKEDLAGSSVAEEVQEQLREALSDSPIAAAINSACYLVRHHAHTIIVFVYLNLVLM